MCNSEIVVTFSDGIYMAKSQDDNIPICGCGYTAEKAVKMYTILLASFRRLCKK
jgi:hypothetical protein